MKNQPTFEVGATGQTANATPAPMPLWKRVLDFVVILAASPLWLPVAGLVALVIRFGSRGPLIFRQQRVGCRGRIFTCYKFRTMQINADQAAHQHHVKDLFRSSTPMIKLDAGNDGRLIPGGAWIRAGGLDELPQLFNVLRGEMSIVGPRPCIPYEYDLYEPEQRHRFDAPPGLTGLWQVSGKNRTTFAEMIRLDIAYARRMCLWLDLKILLLTAPAILQQVLDQRAAKRMWRASRRGAAVARPMSPAIPTQQF